MKKLLLISFLSIAAIAESNAQVTFTPGVKAGLNLSKFTNSDASYKSDFYVGAQFGINFRKFYTLQPELVYSRQGANVPTSYYDQSGNFVFTQDAKYSTDYLSLGVYNKFNFKGFHVGVGPSIDFLLADNFDDNGADDPIGLDISLLAGVGYTFPIGLTVEARIKQGMVDIFGNDYYYDEYDEDYNYKSFLNQSFQIGVSYTFGTKK